MLVLSRKLEQSIQIDADVCIKVISIGSGRVKLGISAPDHVRIIRSELLDWEVDVAVTQTKPVRRHAKQQKVASSALQ